MNILPLVKLHPEIPKSYWPEYGFDPEDTLVILGVVKHMIGHIMVASLKDHKVYGPYDSDNFIELTEEEV